MKGLFRRFASGLSGKGALNEENLVESIPPGGVIDGRFATHTPPPIAGAVKFLQGTERNVEEFEQTFRLGPIGPWLGWAAETGDEVERIMFQADHSGETRVWDTEGALQERCLFEWQEMGDWCIRMRSVAWLYEDVEDGNWDESDEENGDVDGGEVEEEQLDEESEGDEYEEPELGEWEVIEYGFFTSVNEGDEEVYLFRAEQEGFACDCRRGTGPLTPDWDGLRQIIDSRLLIPATNEDELLRATSVLPAQNPETLLAPVIFDDSPAEETEPNRSQSS